MEKTVLKGRSQLGIDLRDILETVRRQDKRHIMPAARDLAGRHGQCSPRYIRARFAAAGLDL